MKTQFHEDHPACWMCLFLGRKQSTKTELHHIAGRGKRHDVRANFAALCSTHHGAIQSRVGAETVCLVLKHRYDPEHFDPATICRLRARADSWITMVDIESCERIMVILREVARWP